MLLSAVLASPAVLMPTTTAWAAPAAPVVSVNIPEGAIVGGQPVAVDVTVDEATTSDAYVHLDFPLGPDDLHITDDTGTPLPLTPLPSGRAVLDLGAADSNGNGIPGAPLTNGTIHLHVAATGPTDRSSDGLVNGYAVDGATGKPTGSATRTPSYLPTSPAFNQRWSGPDSNGGSPDLPMEILGGPETTTLRLVRSVNNATRLIVPADQLSAAGYTPAQFAAAVHVAYTPDDNIPPSPITWTTRDDGSLILDLPASPLPRTATNGYQQLTFHTPWNFPSGRLTAHLLRLAPNDTVVGAADQKIDFESGSTPITYRPIGPTRILDTRNRTGVPGTTAVPPGGTVNLLIAGTHGVPTGASAVVLNVTTTATHTAGFLSVNPHGTNYGSSNLNWSPGQTSANQVITTLIGGRADFTNHSTSTVHVVADLQGYYAATTAPASGYSPTAPTRILDTRNRTGVTTTTPVPAGGSLTLPVPGIAPNTTAVTLNLTATAPTAAGFTTVYPHGQKEPTASSLDWTRGQTVANLVTVPVVDGNIVLHNHSTGTVHLIADLQGTYSPDPGTSTFIPTPPDRVLDTRNRNGVTTTTPLAPGASITLPLSQMGWDNNHRAYKPLTAVALNVTATAPTASGYLTAHPAGTPITTSNLNWTPGQTVPNLVIVPVVDGNITLTNHSTGTVHLIADTFGYYTNR